MKKRLIALSFMLTLVVGLLGVFSLATGAETTPKLSIPYCNLSFRDSVCIKYAVKSNVSDVKLLIWTSPMEEYTVGTHNDEITEYVTETIDGVDHYVFDYTALTAKQMTDVVFARAYVQVDGANYYSEVNKYSILQYAYNKLGKTGTASTDSDFKEMLTQMLAYGAAAQKYFDYKTDRLATDVWFQVKLTAGTLADGSTSGLYPSGEIVTLTAPAADAEGAIFSHWIDSSESVVGTTATLEITVGNANETYSPVYIAAPTFSEGLAFTLNTDGVSYSVSGIGACTDTDVIIPNTYNNLPVTTIGENAFNGRTSLTSITISDGITNINNYAFKNCTGLTNVTVLGNVTKIGLEAFYNCKNLTSVCITDITAWCKITFRGTMSNPLFYAQNLYLNGELVTGLVIPDGVTTLDYTFRNCTSLTSVILSESVTNIGAQAFYGCTNLTSVLIPDSVTSVGLQAFYGCTSLTNVILPESVTSIGAQAFSTCPSLTSINIPDSVTSIGAQAFSGCSRLTSINIPDSVTSVGQHAFSGCTSLTSVYITNIEAWCTIAFDCYQSTYDSNPLYYAHNLYLNEELITDLTIPDSVTSIGEATFYNCTSLMSVSIGKGVTHIGNSAFYGCTNLASIIIPDNSVTSIGWYAFQNCKNLTSVTIGNGVTSIGNSAFYGCTNLVSVTIPESVTRICSSAFTLCNSLTTLTFENSTNWWISTAIGATSGTPVEVTDPSVNATNLKSTYAHYYWNRS